MIANEPGVASRVPLQVQGAFRRQSSGGVRCVWTCTDVPHPALQSPATCFEVELKDGELDTTLSVEPHLDLCALLPWCSVAPQ